VPTTAPLEICMLSTTGGRECRVMVNGTMLAPSIDGATGQPVPPGVLNAHIFTSGGLLRQTFRYATPNWALA